MKEKIVNILKEELELAIKEDEVPVAAVVVKNKEIICSAHNQRETQFDCTAHAEVLCIRKAGKLLDRRILNDCDIYITVFPCKMCQEILKEARIRKIFYILDAKKTNNIAVTVPVLFDVSIDNKKYFNSKLVDFFKCKR